MAQGCRRSRCSSESSADSKRTDRSGSSSARRSCRYSPRYCACTERNTRKGAERREGEEKKIGIRIRNPPWVSGFLDGLHKNKMRRRAPFRTLEAAKRECDNEIRNR